MQKLFSVKLAALFAGQPVLHPDALTHCDVEESGNKMQHLL